MSDEREPTSVADLTRRQPIRTYSGHSKMQLADRGAEAAKEAVQELQGKKALNWFSKHWKLCIVAAGALFFFTLARR